MATLTTTPIKVFVSGETVTPTKLNELSQSTVALTAGTVAVADLATATVERLLPAGAVMPFAMNSAPAGWLAANGDPVLRVGTYAALFAAIGTTYGAGDTSTTFNLPDLRGYFIRGFGTNGDLMASGTFGTKQGASLLNHTHTVSGTTGDDSPDHSHGYSGHVQNNRFGYSGGGGIVGVGTPVTGGSGTGGASVRHQHGFSGTTGNPSAGGGTETRPANIALLYCIKF